MCRILALLVAYIPALNNIQLNRQRFDAQPEADKKAINVAVIHILCMLIGIISYR
jgi:hypothetical protein